MTMAERSHDVFVRRKVSQFEFTRLRPAPTQPVGLSLKPTDGDAMMIQCDKCNVWQHGPCVGIWADEEAPDGTSWSGY
jgi:hypothetical protein